MMIKDESGNDVVELSYRFIRIHEPEWSIQPLVDMLDTVEVTPTEFVYTGKIKWDIVVTLVIEFLNRQYGKDYEKTFTLGIDNDKRYRKL